MTGRKRRTRLPITSRVWFFPAVILLMPLISRVCVNGLSNKPDRRLANHDDEHCVEVYNECVQMCGPQDSTAAAECLAICYEELELCLDQQPADPPEGPACDPDPGFCEYDEYDDYSDYESSDYDDSSTDWSCSSSDDYSDDGSSDGGGWDCSSDNAEGDSGDGDWGEDWGERSPAGGDGIEAPPLDIPN
jgi:hypothetical protein